MKHYGPFMQSNHETDQAYSTSLKPVCSIISYYQITLYSHIQYN